jgi:hypothetical protein
MPQAAKQSNKVPPPPPGYTLDSPAGNIPPPPSGYALDSGSSPSKPAQPQVAIQAAPQSDLSSSLDSMARMYTGQQMATPAQEADFQRGKIAGHLSGAATVAAGTAPAWAGPVAAAAKAHPFYTAFAYHVARELGIPLPKVLDLFSKFAGE